MNKEKSLQGKKVLITRAAAQASGLVDALQELGAEAVEFPTIKIVPLDDYAFLDQAINKLLDGAYDWLIFTSVNGVKYFFNRLEAKSLDASVLKDAKVAVVGKATAKRVEALGLKVDCLPKEFKAEGVIAAFEERGVRGKSILLPRAKVAREILPDALRELGAKVDVAPVYETVPDTCRVQEVKDLLEQKKIDTITFASASSVKNFVKLLKEELDLAKALDKVSIACIGPVTADAAQELGLRVDVVADKYTVDGLVRAIAKVVRRTVD